MYTRRVYSSALVFSLSSHRHSYIGLVFTSRFASTSSSRWGLRVSVRISFCQSGMSPGRLRGEDGGVEEGESGMTCQFSSEVSCFAPVNRVLGGVEFHFLVRILLRIGREESSPLVSIFNRYEVSSSVCDLCYRTRCLAQFVSDGAPFECAPLVL